MPGERELRKDSGKIRPVLFKKHRNRIGPWRQLDQDDFHGRSNPIRYYVTLE